MSEREIEVHPSSVIEPGVELGPGVRIGPFCRLESGVVLGPRVRLDSHVAILGRTRLGADCHVHAGAVVGDLPQDLGFDGAPTAVEIGERCDIREGVTIHRGTKEGTTTVVGDDCLLMATSHVGHNARLGNRVILANGVMLGGYVEMGDRVFVGGNTAVHQFCRAGRLTMLSANAAITRDVPPFMMTRVSTTRVMSLNTVGLRRAGVPAEERAALKRAFRLLYRSGLNVSQAVERIEAEVDSPLARELCEFVRASKRGIAVWVGRGGRAEEVEES